MKKTENIPQIGEDTELKEAIARETVVLLYRAIPGSVVATIVISAFLSAVLWQFFGDKVLVLWFFSIAVINASRFVLYKCYLNRDKNIDNTAFWDKSFYILLFLNGLCFSVIGLFFLPDASVAYHYFPIMVLIGLATGGVATLSFSLRNISTYFILLVFPIFIGEILLGTFISYSVAALILLSLIFSLMNAKKIYQTSIENITLNFHSEKHTQQLIESRNAAIASDRAKNQFVSMISHELRTPLNAIMGFGQLLQLSDDPKLNEEQNENTQGIIDAGKHLLSLIEELLDLSSIESHKLKLFIKNVSLKEIVDESLKLLMPVASQYGIKIINKFEDDYLVKADPKRLKQILINLFSNAIKYNSENGSVILSVEKTSISSVKISVSDTGKGLGKVQLESLFNPFQRHHEKQEGLGLGLYITKNMVELMQGKIGVESVVGKGATFWFEVPLAENGNR